MLSNNREEGSLDPHVRFYEELTTIKDVIDLKKLKYFFDILDSHTGNSLRQYFLMLPYWPKTTRKQ